MIINVERIDPFSLPSVALGQRDQLPKVSGIYFAILGTEILYLGKSVNLYLRWQAHHRTNQLQSYSNVIIAWFHSTSLEERNLEEVEEECIRYFQPMLNRKVRPDSNICMLQKKLGMQIVRLREERRWTQEDLAFEANLAARHVQQLEHGERWPRIDTIERLAWAFQIEPEDLFDFIALKSEV